MARYTIRVTPSAPETPASPTTPGRVTQTIVSGHRLVSDQILNPGGERLAERIEIAGERGPQSWRALGAQQCLEVGDHERAVIGERVEQAVKRRLGRLRMPGY